MKTQGLDPRLNLEQWKDPLWRLENLYWIKDENGRELRFTLNKSQRRLLDALWLRNVILKSRQQGFSTLIQVMMLDMCVWRPNTNAGIILQTMPDAIKLFREKIKFAYNRLPAQIRAAVSVVTDSKTELVLSNGSSLQVATSLRSGTYQFVHVSEMGKIARKFPDRAIEIVTGTFPTVHQDGFLFVESTAEGKDGVFFKIVGDARKHQERGAKLTALDFRFHFFPWHEDARNKMDPAGVEITAENKAYFKKLYTDHGIVLEAPQRAWYAKTKQVLDTAGKDDAMRREHPSFPDEAFEVAVDGQIFGRQMALLRSQHRITQVPALPEPVNTFWDLGHNDINSIWFHQSAPGGEHRFIDYEEGFALGLEHYVKEVRARGYVMGKWVLPHDAEYKNIVNKSPKERLIELGVPPVDIVIVPRCETKTGAIEQARKMLPRCVFDAERCAKGLTHLDNYVWKWDKANGCWRQEPLHNDASNGADAYMQFAQAWDSIPAGGVRQQTKTAARRRGSPMAI